MGFKVTIVKIDDCQRSSQKRDKSRPPLEIIINEQYAQFAPLYQFLVMCERNQITTEVLSSGYSPADFVNQAFLQLNTNG
jgi:hypothetical protein